MSVTDTFLVAVYCLELAGVIGVVVWIAYWLLKYLDNGNGES
jgi:hypothetical protein